MTSRRSGRPNWVTLMWPVRWAKVQMKRIRYPKRHAPSVRISLRAGRRRRETAIAVSSDMAPNILADPPKIVTEGEVAYFTYFNMDAGKCKHYDEMEFIDHDATEIADPSWSRVYRKGISPSTDRRFFESKSFKEGLKGIMMPGSF